MIAIVDYGAGNPRSVEKAFLKVGVHAQATDDAELVRRADGIVLPGVGAFGAAMECLQRSGLESAVREGVAAGKPFLGICVGLQLLFETSEEAFRQSRTPRGLGLLAGTVRRFPQGQKVPQIGWNRLIKSRETPLLDGVPDGSYAYFVHSYYAAPADQEAVACRTEYGVSYCSAVAAGNLFAVQFHPQKSSRVGLRILRNFGALCGL